MTKENVERIKERIRNIMQIQVTDDHQLSYEGIKQWERGYNTACEQILEIIEGYEKE